jgi:hypothetical protein
MCPLLEIYDVIVYFLGEKSMTPPHPFVTVTTVAPDVLVGIAEIADLLGVTKNTAVKYTRRPDFPEPLDRLASGPVWSRQALDGWARATLPLPMGRPRKREEPRG